LYILTTSIAITLALTIAALLSVGKGTELTISANFVIKQAPSIKDTIIDLFPVNPFEAVVEGKMLQVIVFSIFFGIAITMTGKAGNSVKQFFNALNEIVMTLIMFLMHVAPYGVFCLIASLFAEMGYSVIIHLFNYFFTVLLVLLIHLLLTNSILLKFLARLSPITFFKKIYSAMIFAFSTSSSSVSIPVVLETVEKKLGVNNSVASFIIPLGATINMDGTAIMQGVATVFIAHAYNIPIGLLGYIQVVAIATLASIGTAGVPGVGLITLTMVLRQVGLPVEGISLIIGVDRLLDMARTAVNITGDSTISCVISRSENAFDRDIFDSPDPD